MKSAAAVEFVMLGPKSWAKSLAEQAMETEEAEKLKELNA